MDGGQFLHQFLFVVVDWVAVGHPVSFVHVTCVAMIIFHIVWLYVVPFFITEVTFFWWIVNIGQHVNVSFVPSHPWFALKCHRISFSFSCVLSPLACPFYLVSQSWNNYFLTSPFYFPRKLCHCSMCSCQVLHLMLFVLSKYSSMSYVLPVESPNWYIFMAKHLCSHGMYYLETTIPLWRRVTLSTVWKGSKI